MSENVENNAVQNMDLFEQRTAKIRDYQEAGINPFGGAFPNVELIEVVRTKELPPEGCELPGPEATIAGRMTAKRGMGKSIFADLRDSTGRLQLFAGKSDMPEEMFALCAVDFSYVGFQFASVHGVFIPKTRLPSAPPEQRTSSYPQGILSHDVPSYARG